MNNLNEIWAKRFQHYMNELQRYMKYVFTGHLAIVLMFVIGAGGFAYSEWLKTVPDTFPAALLISLVLGVILAFSTPVTLIKEADIVYFLPLEKKLIDYMRKALSWTISSQIFLSIVVAIVSLPLISKVEGTKGIFFIILLLFVFALKMWNVNVEFAFRWSNAGQGVWGDRIVRFLLSASALYFVIIKSPILIVLIVLPIFYYSYVWRGKMKEKAFPFEHFIKVEQNRMLRFYRFANYFTDVPHLSGTIRRRGWLNFIYRFISYGQKSTQSYLVTRTFIRTDDTFYLWLRLSILSILGAVFIPIPIVSAIFVGALSFAAALQLKYALNADADFRMDMLYPIDEFARRKAVIKLVRVVQWMTALLVLFGSLFQPAYGVNVWLLPAIVIIISEATIRLSK